MKVVPGTSPSSRQTHKTARYMEVSTDALQIGCFCFFCFVLFASSIIGLLPSCPGPSVETAGCCLTFDPASFDSLFPRIPRCCRLQRDSRWRTVFRSIRTGWRCTKQVQLRREEPMADRVVQARARLLTGMSSLSHRRIPENPRDSWELCIHERRFSWWDLCGVWNHFDIFHLWVDHNRFEPTNLHGEALLGLCGSSDDSRPTQNPQHRVWIQVRRSRSFAQPGRLSSVETVRCADVLRSVPAVLLVPRPVRWP